MIRRTTELEKRLISNGWYLTSKNYYGKGSNKTLCYNYTKTFELKEMVVDAIVVISPKRDEVFNVSLALFDTTLLEKELPLYQQLFDIIKHEINGDLTNEQLDNPYEEDDEVVFTVEAVENA